jgi:hypothetical protein
MIDHADTVVGKHYWAISKHFQELLVVLNTQGGYEVCGPWEAGISPDEIEIIQEIAKPPGYEEYGLYYSIIG